MSALPLNPARWSRRYRWPLPAVGAWVLAWCLFVLIGGLPGAGAALLLSAALAWRQPTPWRRAWVALGFPLSALALGGAGLLPAWAWLLPPALLLLLYPPRAWRDAPVFPTPHGALGVLARQLPLAPGARVLDAGCGLGDGLIALRAAWPGLRLEGVEWSAPLAWATRLRCPWAQVRRGDLWQPGSWQGLAAVYLFQRPESMACAWDKAVAEMPGGWLISLEFAVPEHPPTLRCDLGAGREVMAWRIPSQPGAVAADNLA